MVINNTTCDTTEVSKHRFIRFQTNDQSVMTITLFHVGKANNYKELT